MCWSACPPGARVAVVRLRSLGDCVLTTPALALLKQTRPDLEIAVVVEDAFAPIFAGNPDVARILAPRAAEIARWRPQLTLNLHGGATSVRLTLASAARLRAGFGHFRFQPVYNVRIPRAQEILGIDRKVHTAEHLASAMFYLGVPRTEIPRARLFATTRLRPRPYAVMHPMASAPDKTWPSANFLAVAEHLDRHLGLEPVFIAGPGEDLAGIRSLPLPCGRIARRSKIAAGGRCAVHRQRQRPRAHGRRLRPSGGRVVRISDRDIWSPWRTESVVLTNPNGIHSIGVSEVVQATSTHRPLASHQPLATSHRQPPQ